MTTRGAADIAPGRAELDTGWPETSSRSACAQIPGARDTPRDRLLIMPLRQFLERRLLRRVSPGEREVRLAPAWPQANGFAQRRFGLSDCMPFCCQFFQGNIARGNRRGAFGRQLSESSAASYGPAGYGASPSSAGSPDRSDRSRGPA